MPENDDMMVVKKRKKLDRPGFGTSVGAFVTRAELRQNELSYCVYESQLKPKRHNVQVMAIVTVVGGSRYSTDVVATA